MASRFDSWFELIRQQASAEEFQRQQLGSLEQHYAQQVYAAAQQAALEGVMFGALRAPTPRPALSPPPTGAGTPSEVPQPSPSAPVVRVVCACGQEIPLREADKFSDNMDWPPDDVCADCWGCADRQAFGGMKKAPLDQRIAEAKRPEADPTDGFEAWATPSAEGVEWK